MSRDRVCEINRPMKLNSALTINGKQYQVGDEVSGWFIYPFFMLHMGLFGMSGLYGLHGLQ